MAVVVTVAERRTREIERLQSSGAAVITELRAYAVANGVRFHVFGSFARGDLVASSDFDVVVDGPEERQRPAREAVEAACERNGLRPDVYLASEVSPGLNVRVERDALFIP